MKQTAVEWLYEEFTKTNYLTEDEFYMKFQQAKEMEKEQIIKAHTNGWNKGIQNEFTISQQYYKETYESKTNI
jgi:hypothetical protein